MGLRFILKLSLESKNSQFGVALHANFAFSSFFTASAVLCQTEQSAEADFSAQRQTAPQAFGGQPGNEEHP